MRNVSSQQLLTPSASVTSLLRVIAGLSREDTGKVYDFRGKGTLHDAVRKHFSGYVLHVLSNDRLPEWADSDPEDDSRPDVERRRRLKDFGRLPRRLEPLERVGRLVECEDFLCARID